MISFEMLSLFFAVCAFLISVFSLIEIKAIQRSTHKVQFYNPIKDEFTQLTEEQKRELTKEPFDNI